MTRLESERSLRLTKIPTQKHHFIVQTCSGSLNSAKHVEMIIPWANSTSQHYWTERSAYLQLLTHAAQRNSLDHRSDASYLTFDRALGYGKWQISAMTILLGTSRVDLPADTRRLQPFVRSVTPPKDISWLELRNLACSSSPSPARVLIVTAPFSFAGGTPFSISTCCPRFDAVSLRVNA